MADQERLPDELWLKALHLGLSSGKVDYRDVCLLAMVCRQLRRLCDTDQVWSLVWDSESASFRAGSSSNASSAADDDSWKSRYKARFERVKMSKRLAHQQRLFSAECDVALYKRLRKELYSHADVEQERLSRLKSQLSHMERARQASVALNVWQPQTVRTAIQQLVEQQPLISSSHKHYLEMEVRVSKDQLQRIRTSLNRNKLLLEKAEKLVVALNFQPLQEQSYPHTQEQRRHRRPTRRKRLKA